MEKEKNNSNNARNNLAKMKERLKNIGIEFEEILPRETICRSCSRNVEHIEAKDAIRDSWIKNARCKRRKVQYECKCIFPFYKRCKHKFFGICF